VVNVLGVRDSLVLFQSGDSGVVIDKDVNLIVETGDAEALFASSSWNPTSEEISQSMFDLAHGALADLEIKVIVASGRLYTIPRGVQVEAKRGLEWRKEHKRGGTPVGVNTARTLSKGGQIGIEKVRHIAKYFPRHEIDKKATGYQPGEKGFPSRGRIAWALWGGDAGWRWAQAIVERENKKSLTADGYGLPGYEQDSNEYEAPRLYTSDLEAFKEAMEKPEIVSPEFIARVRLDGSGIDRLYKIDLDGSVFVWDGSGWDTLGLYGADIYSYDNALDNNEDTYVEKSHVVVDPDSAIIISARLQLNPDRFVLVEDIDYDEAQLAARAMSEVDWEYVDSAMTAAGEESTAPAGDGQYTPEERSENAARQVRDASGRFASQGSRVVVGGDVQNGVGTIRAINPESNTVKIQFDNGTTADVPAQSTEKVDKYIGAISRETVDTPAFDTSGILAQPRTPIDRPDIQIPGTLPALRPSDMSEIVGNWPAWVKSQRDQFKAAGASAPTSAPAPSSNLKTSPTGAPTPAPTSPGGSPISSQAKPDRPETRWYDESKIPDDRTDKMKDLMKTTGAKLTLDAYDHPLLKNFLNKTVKTKSGEIQKPNQLWYQPVAPAVRGAAAAEEMTPDTSDVQPLFMALVSPDDPRAVMDLIALVPANSSSTLPMTYKRAEGKWIRDEGILGDLNSATPPPVVPLDSVTLQDVLKQIDTNTVTASVIVSETLDHILTVLWGPTLVAAGGLDRNRGNAEKLRRYWTVGKGGLKIRWNTGGDWTRCVRQLSKYLGPRAKGYCALRHKEMTGMWTGDKKHRQLYGRKGRGRNAFSTDVIATSEEIIDRAALNARARDARVRMGLTASIEGYEGAAFKMPLVIPEEIESGDGRKFRKGAIDIRELPLPLMWQIKTGEGHMGSVVVGRIDQMERTDQGIGNAYGVFDTGEYGKEAERLVREGFVRGVSADMDMFEAKEEKIEAGDDTEGKVGNGKIDITKARVMGVTIVPKPAFQECKIFLVEEEKEIQEDNVIPDGVYVEDVDPTEAASLVACGFVAGAIPVVPPKSWFENQQLNKPTPLTVTDEGQVYGHIAAWHVDHIGLAYGTKPPRSKSKYAYFHTGVVRTDDGVDVPVGQLTLAGGHAPLEASAHEAARHYDDTASAIADVHAGEDAYGIWVAGSIRPGASPEQIRALRASAPSGDWRPIKNSLELVAVCQVNVPGFPIARARVASGQVMALVAAGASTLAKLKSDPVSELAARIQKLEQLELTELSIKADSARERFADIRAARRAELQAQITELSSRVLPTEEYEDGFGYISREKRQKLAKKGLALPDGSYPITNVDSLKDSIQAYGRGKPSKRAAIRRHIMKRARVLDRADLIPEKWKAMSSEEISFAVEGLRSRIPALTASTEAGMDECGMCKEFGCICPGCVGQKCGCMQGCTCPRCHTNIGSYNNEESDDLGKASAVEFAEPEAKYISGKTQPRDNKGKFRTVLARIKQNLGDSGLQDVIDKVTEAEGLESGGNYVEAARSATDLIGIIDRLDSGALDSVALTNVRESARALGETIANLPLPFGAEATKVRFSDLPPALRDLVDDMIMRVEAKIGKKDADVATEGLRSYMSGGDFLNQSQISSELSKMLRLLT
jgi:hypothetical protein